jgi:hypothetical protein
MRYVFRLQITQINFDSATFLPRLFVRFTYKRDLWGGEREAEFAGVLLWRSTANRWGVALKIHSTHFTTLTTYCGCGVNVKFPLSFNCIIARANTKVAHPPTHTGLAHGACVLLCHFAQSELDSQVKMQRVDFSRAESASIICTASGAGWLTGANF